MGKSVVAALADKGDRTVALIFHNCHLDMERRELHREGQVMALEPKAFLVLVHLVTHRDRAVAKEELLETCWPGEFVTEAALARSVRLIRQAVGDTGDQQLVIKTLRSYGYRFVAAVATRPHAAESPLPAAVSAPKSEHQTIAPTLPTPELLCPQCQSPNRTTRKFCAACGHELWTSCPHCDFHNAPAERFCGGCGREVVAPVAVSPRARPDAPRMYPPAHLAQRMLATPLPLAGERKQVTVLFADLQDSTRMIQDLDPEAVQQLLDPAISRMMEAVHRFEGTVNQVLGDGIMALFGAPIAHEDHALRACYAALAMQAAMQEYAAEIRHTHDIDMHMRVGLNSGEVVVRAIRNDLHMDYSAVGQTTHLAARMEHLATPGTIRLTPATLRLVEGLVRVVALGPVPVKGLAAPIEVFELVGVSTVRKRLQAGAMHGLTPFVGRDVELATLWQALEHAGAGRGQILAIIGEAGVGKSRLIYEFLRSHRLQGWLILESTSASYGKATPYFPLIDLLRRYCHVEERDDPRTIRYKVTERVLKLDEALQEALPALLALLDVLPDDSPFGKLDPTQRRQRMIEALKLLVLRESQGQPLVLVFEDLHWIDSETQALLDSLVVSLPTVQLLLLVNYCPEYQHGWGSKTYYTQLRLDPLPPVSADGLLHAVLGDDSSLAALSRLLTARTAGNPFFLEESVRTLIEAGGLVGEPGAYRLTQTLPTIQIPATVQAVLARVSTGCRPRRRTCCRPLRSLAPKSRFRSCAA
jgi:class 3 adenylate cyclase/DNA-binding winged helix-turn-helix (wHTH) protein